MGWLILNHMVQYIDTARRNARAGRARAPSALPSLFPGADGRCERRSERAMCAFSARVRKQDRQGNEKRACRYNCRIVATPKMKPGRRPRPCRLGPSLLTISGFVATLVGTFQMGTSRYWPGSPHSTKNRKCGITSSSGGLCSHSQPESILQRRLLT